MTITEPLPNAQYRVFYIFFAKSQLLPVHRSFVWITKQRVHQLEKGLLCLAREEKKEGISTSFHSYIVTLLWFLAGERHVTKYSLIDASTEAPNTHECMSSIPTNVSMLT